MSFRFSLPADRALLRINTEPDTENGTKMNEWIKWKMRKDYWATYIPIATFNETTVDTNVKRNGGGILSADSWYEPVNEKAKHKCNCSRQQLMRDGCKCGGI